MTLDLQSERFTPTGNLAAEGLLNALGRPRQGLLPLLLRECVQNSWDARESTDAALDFSIADYSNPAAGAFLRDVVFAERPAGTLIESHLADQRLLVIRDSGTVGLAGPTRADVPSGSGPRNFLNFLRNVGLPTRREFGAGTFGYGKAAPFLASKARAMCVYSRCRNGDQEETRFMAVALGLPHEGISESGRALYTGRHWWGRSTGDVVEPLRHKEADDAATMLGIDHFPQGRCGTAIAIIAPSVDDWDGPELGKTIVSTLLWNFWPKMVPSVGAQGPAMRFHVRLGGRTIVIPLPEEDPLLGPFALALRRVRGENENADALGLVRSITCERPKRLLGRLSLQRFARVQAAMTGASPLGEHIHHVALMRQPELVVRYLAGAQSSVSGIEYAGVFLADASMDDVFARSEPPTHDDWTHESLTDSRERTYVRVTHRRILDATRDFTLAAVTEPVGGESLPLGAFSSYLGDLLPGQGGVGAAFAVMANTQGARASEGGSQGRPGSEEEADRIGPSRQGSPRLTAREPVLSEGPSGLELRVAFDVRHGEGTLATTVRAYATVVLEDEGKELEPPHGSSSPTIARWEASDGAVERSTDTLRISNDDARGWVVVVTVPDDALVTVDFSARGVRA